VLGDARGGGGVGPRGVVGGGARVGGGLDAADRERVEHEQPVDGEEDGEERERGGGGAVHLLLDEVEGREGEARALEEAVEAAAHALHRRA